jgi:protein-S-isoprenylcysteine O-methyltransferase Ste14
MNYALFTIALISFLTYAIAIKFVFADDYGVDIRTKIITICTALFAIVHLWLLWRTPMHSPRFAVMALLTYLAGLIIFFAARHALSIYRSTLSFTPDLPAWMLHKGIYSVVRHPFFLAYCFTWLGGVLAANCLRTSTTTVIMIFLYWRAAKMQEGKFENSPLAGEYRIYKSRTGMFLPSLKLFR